MSKEVMQIAYDALTTVHRGDFEDDCEFNYEKCWKAIKALKVELDKPEPVSMYDPDEIEKTVTMLKAEIEKLKEPKLKLVDFFYTVYPNDDSKWEQDSDHFYDSIPLYRLET